MINEEQVYVQQTPDIGKLAEAYKSVLTDLDPYFLQCRDNYDNRRNLWPGKSFDLRKNGEDAFPWKGASDQEANTIGERIETYVALGMQALSRANIKAFPTKMDGMSRASVVSSFVKWLKDCRIHGFMDEMERAWNFGLEKGLLVTYCGWDRQERSVLEQFTLDQIAAVSPEVAEMIMDPENDDGLASLLTQQYPRLSMKRAKKAVRDLRKKGVAELAVSRPTIDRPCVEALLPDGEVFFPNWSQDISRAPHVFWRKLMTAQEIEKKVTTDGWDRGWADYVINNLAGHGVQDLMIDTEYLQRTSNDRPTTVGDNQDLYTVVFGFQRLIDEEDGSEGIYLTVFTPWHTDETNAPAFAKHELLNGFDDYPFVVTRMDQSTKSLYDVRAMPEALRGAQWAIKVERDSRIDRNSESTLPALTGPAGRPPADRGPGRYIPVRRPGEYTYLQVPPVPGGSVEIENTLNTMADRAVGLDYAIPNAPLRQQYFINKLLSHAREVLRMSYKNFQRFGDDQVFFTVTGVPDPVTMENIRDEDFHLVIDFDVTANDPEMMNKKLAAVGTLFAGDRDGRMSSSRYIEFAARAIDPAFADYVLLPEKEQTRELMKAITDDFAKLYAGIAIGPQPNGAQVTLQMLQGWLSSPDVADRYQGDENFQKRVDDYAKQAQFQIAQQENAVTGRIGTTPTQFQGTNTVA